MTRKRLIIVCIVAFTVGLIAFMGGIGGGGFSGPSVEEPRIVDGENLYQGIMANYPDLVRDDFHMAKDDPEGTEPNVMKLPKAEWEAIDQAQQVSLAQYLDSMGGEWMIQVGRVSSDGKQIRSARSVITSGEWHQTLR